MNFQDAIKLVEGAVEEGLCAPPERLSRENKMRMIIALDIVIDLANVGAQVQQHLNKSKAAKPNRAAGKGEPDAKGDGNTDPKDLHAQLTQAAVNAEIDKKE